MDSSYRAKINWALSGVAYAEKTLQKTLSNLLGDQVLFDPKEVKHLLEAMESTSNVAAAPPPEKKGGKKSRKKDKKNKKSTPVSQPHRKQVKVKSGGSRKEEIIRDNKLRLEKQASESDLAKIRHFILNRTDWSDVSSLKLKTSSGKVDLLFRMLEKSYRHQDLLEIVDLYLDLRSFPQEEYSQMYQKYSDIYRLSTELIQESIPDLFLFQLEKLGSRMPPLNRFPVPFQLDTWQKEALLSVLHRESALICAPTSSGKTVITTFISILPGPMVFIVPTEPLVWQVASIFNPLLGGSISLISENIEHISSSNTHLFIGTPYMMESYLSEHNLFSSLQYAIFDEIHDLNGPQGDSLERLIKMLDCPMLALSATVGNAEQIREWWSQFTPMKLINHSGRFLNLHRHFMSGKDEEFQIIPPLSMWSLEQIQSPHFMKTDLALTPSDLFLLWKEIQQQWPPKKVYSLQPRKFFSEKTYRITLSQCREYESELQQFLHLQSQEHPELVDKILTDLSPHTEDDSVDETVPSVLTSMDLYRVLEGLKNHDMLPSLWFQLSPSHVHHYYLQLLDRIESEEERRYPDFHKNVEQAWKQFYQEKERAEKFSQTQEQEEREAECVEKTNVTPPSLNIGDPHPNLTYTIRGQHIPKDMLTNFIRKLGRELNLKIRSDMTDADVEKTKVSAHPLVRGLRRGIGLYSQFLPLAYLQVVQRLAQSGVLGVVISDNSLAYGVNMPFRAVVYCGDHPQLNPLMAQQMGGRSGRRGLDKEGHLVYVGISWNKIKRLNWGCLPNITGHSHITYLTLPFQNHLAPFTKNMREPYSLHRICQSPLYHHIHSSTPKENQLEYFQECLEKISPMGDPSQDSEARDHYQLRLMVWMLRAYVPESLVLWKLTDEIRRTFSCRKDENDDIRMFLLLSHLISRRPAVEGKSILPPLQTILPDLAHLLHSVQESFPPEGRLPSWGEDQLDGTMYYIFRENRIPEEISLSEMEDIKHRFRYMGEVCRSYRNYLIHLPKYLSMEEILRKTFRRVYYLCNHI